MNYGEIRTKVKNYLNISGMTDALANDFIDMSFQAIQRRLRVPAMETTYQYTPSGAASTSISIPSDYLELKQIVYHAGGSEDRTLTKMELGDLLRVDKAGGGIPKYFARKGAAWELRPSLGDGNTLDIVYYKEIDALSADSDTNWATTIVPDLVIYGALVEGAAYYQDERYDRFVAAFESKLAATQLQGDMEAMSGSPQVVQPAYGTEY